MKCRPLSLCVLAAVPALCACRSGRPVGAFACDVPQNTSPKAVPQKMMHDAIVRGCLERGWGVTEPSADLIEAAVAVRGKHTVVDIPCTAAHYTTSGTRAASAWSTQDQGRNALHPPQLQRMGGPSRRAIRRNILTCAL